MLGLAGSFGVCFGLSEQLHPGPENIKSGLNRAVRPPYGLILSVRGATGPRMPLEALNTKNLFMIFGLTPLGHAPVLCCLFPRVGFAIS